MKGVDQLFRRGWSLDEDAEPSERVCPNVLLADLLLAVDPDLAPSGELGEVEPVPTTTELQVYAVVDGPLAIHPLSDARLSEQFRRPMLEHASPDRRLYHVAA